MRQWFNFFQGKIDQSDMKFIYLRVGKTEPVLEDLHQRATELQLEFKQIELNSLR